MVNDQPEVMRNSVEYLWLEEEIIPKIVQALGKDAENYRYEIKVPNESYFISAIYMAELIFCCDGGSEVERIKLVVKISPNDESARAFVKTDTLFHNEMIFYQRFGKHYSDYPKCVLIVRDSITRVAIVLENVMQFGYKVVETKKDMEMKRALVAVREVGKFHARGYVLKEKNPNEFFSVVEELREFHDNSAHPVYMEYINALSMRPLNYLRSVNYDPEFCNKMSNFLSKAYEKIFQDCVKPKNDLAVFCHGDFTLNNILLREEDDGKFQAMLIDFAQFRYASPATDISNFLYLNCEDAVRKNFPVIFKAHHDAVIEYLEEQGIQDLEKYSYNAFLKDYKRHAIIGCGIAFFFKPLTSLDYRISFSDYINNYSENLKNLMAVGGEALSKRLANMLLELRDNGCLDHII